MNNADNMREISDTLYSTVTEQFLEMHSTDYLKIINEFIK